MIDIYVDAKILEIALKRGTNITKSLESRPFRQQTLNEQAIRVAMSSPHRHLAIKKGDHPSDGRCFLEHLYRLFQNSVPMSRSSSTRSFTGTFCSKRHLRGKYTQLFRLVYNIPVDATLFGEQWSLFECFDACLSNSNRREIVYGNRGFYVQETDGAFQL